MDSVFGGALSLSESLGRHLLATSVTAALNDRIHSHVHDVLAFELHSVLSKSSSHDTD